MPIKQLASRPLQNPVTVSFQLPRGCDAATNIPSLLYAIQRLGNWGSSRSITVVEGNEDNSDFTIGFDGDGSDAIVELMVDGKVYKEN